MFVGKIQVPMDAKMAKMYRSAAAKLNYLSLDNSRIAYKSKEASRSIAKPINGDEVKLKRILRLLRSHPVSAYEYHWQECQNG